MPRLLIAVLALLVLVLAPVQAGGGPAEVVVVVNADSPASLAIANAWIMARRIHPSHVVALRGLSSHESIPVEEFRGRILLPVLLELERRGLAGQVQWIVYSADLPWAVDFANDLALRPIPPTIGRTAALTGLTVLAPLVAARNPAYCLSRIPNPLYRLCPNELGLGALALPEPGEAGWGEARRLHQEKAYGAAAAILGPLFAATDDPGVGYDLACALTLAGDQAAGLAALLEAEQAGWNNPDHTLADSDLESLRALPAFTALIARLRARSYAPPETRAWDRRLVRRDDGYPALAARPTAGWLSAMLAVTTGRGLSVREALAGLARSVAAEATRPAGTVYLMRNGNVRSTTRQWAFSGVVDELGHLGGKAEIVDGSLPMGRDDVAGLVAGSATLDWPGCGSTILPGAICEHLTSCGGMMGWNSTQTPLTELLRRGAAGATGTVDEPYALQYKFPTPFIQVHYQRGATLGEAVWLSVANPYQLLLVGDPLCAPWAVPPRLVVEDLALSGGELRLEVGAGPGGPALAEVRLEVDGRERWRGAPGAVVVPVAGWPAGPHRLTVTGVARGAVAAQAGAEFTVGEAGPLRLECAVPVVGLEGRLALRLTTLAGTRTVLTQLGRDLWTMVGGGSHELALPAWELGLGRSELQLEARDPAGAVLARSSALTVEVAEPAVLPSPLGGSAEPAGCGPGVRLIPFDQESPGVVVAKGRLEGNWLGEALGERARGELLAGWWIHAGSEDLTQIQIRALRPLEVSLDGEPLRLGGSDGWRFGLVRLQPGWHRLHLRLGAGDPRVEIRLGVAGTAPLAAESCRCPAPSVVQPGADAAEAAEAAE